MKEQRRSNEHAQYAALVRYLYILMLFLLLVACDDSQKPDSTTVHPTTQPTAAVDLGLKPTLPVMSFATALPPAGSTAVPTVALDPFSVEAELRQLCERTPDASQESVTRFWLRPGDVYTIFSQIPDGAAAGIERSLTMRQVEPRADFVGSEQHPGTFEVVVDDAVLCSVLDINDISSLWGGGLIAADSAPDSYCPTARCLYDPATGGMFLEIPGFMQSQEYRNERAIIPTDNDFAAARAEQFVPARIGSYEAWYAHVTENGRYLDADINRSPIGDDAEEITIMITDKRSYDDPAAIVGGYFAVAIRLVRNPDGSVATRYRVDRQNQHVRVEVTSSGQVYLVVADPEFALSDQGVDADRDVNGNTYYHHFSPLEFLDS